MIYTLNSIKKIVYSIYLRISFSKNLKDTWRHRLTVQDKQYIIYFTIFLRRKEFFPILFIFFSESLRMYLQNSVYSPIAPNIIRVVKLFFLGDKIHRISLSLHFCNNILVYIHMWSAYKQNILHLIMISVIYIIPLPSFLQYLHHSYPSEQLVRQPTYRTHQCLQRNPI